MPTMSAAQFIPKTNSPEDMRRAFEAQALWIERQGQTNQAHWLKLQELEQGCRDCRNDRRAIDTLTVARLEELKTVVAEFRSGFRWTTIAARALFGVATLFIAAKAAGLLK